MDIKIYRASEDVVIPVYKTAGSAGCDLTAFIKEPITIGAQTVVRIPTGIHLGLPMGFEAQVRSRSSMVAKGLFCPIGTIDCDYRGEISVVLVNVRKGEITVMPGDRIAQLIIAPVTRAVWDEVKALEDLGMTVRGHGGYGSTGR
jgi:dUTP pyrophosphatase